MFKAGDKVVCVTPNPGMKQAGIIKGYTTTVLATYGDGYGMVLNSGYYSQNKWKKSNLKLRRRHVDT
jgi:succinate dehydrogenase/fumarate reductase flavoprotein subunit